MLLTTKYPKPWYVPRVEVSGCSWYDVARPMTRLLLSFRVKPSSRQPGAGAGGAAGAGSGPSSRRGSVGQAGDDWASGVATPRVDGEVVAPAGWKEAAAHGAGAAKAQRSKERAARKAKQAAAVFAAAAAKAQAVREAAKARKRKRAPSTDSSDYTSGDDEDGDDGDGDHGDGDEGDVGGATPTQQQPRGTSGASSTARVRTTPLTAMVHRQHADSGDGSDDSSSSAGDGASRGAGVGGSQASGSQGQGDDDDDDDDDDEDYDDANDEEDDDNGDANDEDHVAADDANRDTHNHRHAPPHGGRATAAELPLPAAPRLETPTKPSRHAANGVMASPISRPLPPPTAVGMQSQEADSSSSAESYMYDTSDGEDSDAIPAQLAARIVRWNCTNCVHTNQLLRPAPPGVGAGAGGLSDDDSDTGGFFGAGRGGDTDMHAGAGAANEEHARAMAEFMDPTCEVCGVRRSMTDPLPLLTVGPTAQGVNIHQIREVLEGMAGDDVMKPGSACRTGIAYDSRMLQVRVCVGMCGRACVAVRPCGRTCVCVNRLWAWPCAYAHTLHAPQHSEVKKPSPMPSASHPERPHRLAAIAQHLVVKELFQRCIRINGRLARRSELATVHTEDHCDMIMSLENVGPEGYSFGADTCVTYAATAPPLAGQSITWRVLLRVCHRQVRMLRKRRRGAAVRRHRACGDGEGGEGRHHGWHRPGEAAGAPR